MKNIVYFDLETKKLAAEVGGWDRKDEMLMSVGVLYISKYGEYRIYQENRVEEMIEEMKRADLVVGFNTIGFDYQVLKRYYMWDLGATLSSLDICEYFTSRMGHRIGLESIAQASFGVGKIAEGTDAVKWWREGKKSLVAEYCCFDVKVTKMVHEFGLENGFILYSDRQGKSQKFEVDWKV